MQAGPPPFSRAAILRRDAPKGNHPACGIRPEPPRRAEGPAGSPAGPSVEPRGVICSAARGRRQLLPLVVFHTRALALEEPNRRGGQPGDGREQEELLDLPALLGAALVSHGVPPQGVVEGVGGAGWTRTIDLILIRERRASPRPALLQVAVRMGNRGEPSGTVKLCRLLDQMLTTNCSACPQ